MTDHIHLHSTARSIVLASVDGSVPALSYWGVRLRDDDPMSIELIGSRPRARATLDVEAPIGLVAEVGGGFPGSPGVAGHRSTGDGHAPRFGRAEVSQTTTEERDAVEWRLADPVAELSLVIDVALCRRSDVVEIRATLVNDGSSPYHLDRLLPSIALPPWATELLTLGGRWTLEFQQHRHRWQQGAWVEENRRGRTSHDRNPTLFVGTEGFDEVAGDVWGLHLGWSGNSRIVAERLSDGRRHVQVGELLASGEAIIGPGEALSTPVVYGAYSPAGLGEVSLAFHRHLRLRAVHPGPDRPRPVTLNTWEAVYFDHDLDALRRLASVAAEVGVERFVLDDGWFTGRNDDTAALGDWSVDPVKYPDGLGPLVDHVRSLGMEFGLWVEPEMVNPDSELFRRHPSWALGDHRYTRPLGRNQLVLDLVDDEAWHHVLGSLDRLLDEHDIGYLKWDMNRDLVQPTHGTAASARAQTLAVYWLIDELRRRHPGVEIESCSSGGARIDFGILQRTERVWASDSNDALDRQAIQRGLSLFVPPEVIGAHIGPPVSHTTGRTHDLGLRSASAFLCHLGIEWNLLEAPAAERAELADFVALHKQHRALLHSGHWRRLDQADRSVSVMGVVAPDRAEAVFVVARVSTSPESVPPRIRFAHLDPDRNYRLTNLPLPGRSADRGSMPPRWLTEPDVVVSGRVLMQHGLQLPVQDPESAVLVHLGTVEAPSS